MQIQRPLANHNNLLLASNILPDSDLELLQTYFTMSNYLRGDRPWPWPSKQIPEMSKDRVSGLYPQAKAVLEKLDDIAKDVFRKEYPHLNLVRFMNYGNASIYMPGEYMEAHNDGPPNSIRDHGVRSAAMVFYINDDYEGGQLSYPNIGYDYQPVANTAMFHTNDPEFKHGALPVISGWRIAYGVFGFEDYNEDVIMENNTERPYGT